MKKLSINTKAKPKKSYVTPKLTRYGKVTELTAGATGMASESSMSATRRA